MNEILLQQIDGPLLVLTLNEPERANPLSPEMATALTAALESAAREPSVRAVILVGAGKHFSAGADLSALQKVAEGGDIEANVADSRRLEALFAVLLGHPKLTLAAVGGAAIAGGCGLATACDFVVAEPHSRFSYTEVKIGFIPALVSTFLTRRVPGHVVRRLVLDPEILDGRQALELGLVDELAEDGKALVRARELALSICRKASPSALAATKTLMNDSVGMGWREALRVAAEANVEQRMHHECRRGVRSFLETKATPDWLTQAEEPEGGDDSSPVTR
jgi:methylglutaconyl-CoA hydratase